MYTNALSLADGIGQLVKTSDDTHRLIQLSLRTWLQTDHTLAASWKRVAAETRQLSGRLHSTHLLASVFTEENYGISAEYNLNSLRACSQTLRVLHAYLQQKHRRTSSGVRTKTSLPASGPPGGESAPDDFYPGDLSELPNDLGRYCVNLAVVLMAETFPAMLATLSQRHVPTIQDNLPPLTRVLSNPEKARKEVFDGLCPYDPFNLLATVAERHQRFRLPWVRHEKGFKAWIDPELTQSTVPRLWLYGDAGTGKTSLALSIVEELLDRSFAVCFHFVDWRNDDTKRPANVLGSLIWQLASRRTDAYNKLRDYFGLLTPEEGGSGVPRSPPALPSTGESRDPRDLQVLSEAFRIVQGCFETVYVVIDGLDEMEQTASMIQAISLGATNWTNTRALFLSRDEKQLRDICAMSSFEALKILPRPADIKQLIGSVLENQADRRLERIAATTKEEITAALLAARPNFRYVECQLNRLLSLSSDEERHEALLALPLTLEASYAAILERSFSGSCADMATATTKDRDEPQSALLLKTSLHWMARTSDLHNLGKKTNGNRATYSVQPTILELCQAIAVFTATSATCTSQLRPIDPEEVAHLARGLIRQRNSNHWEIGHRTVYEFLARLGPSDGRLGFFSFRDTAKTDVDMATTLLRFLNFQDFNNVLSEVKIEKARRRQRLKSDPLYGYAAAWWPLLSNGHWQSVSSLVLALFRAPTSNNFMQWILQYCTRHFDHLYESVLIAGPLLRLVDLFTKPYMSPLHVAACLGLPALCRALVETGEHDVNSNDPSGLGSPLYLALLGPQALGLFSTEPPEMIWRLLHGGPASLRRKETVETLLSLGATFDGGKTPLRASIASLSFLACAIMEDAQLFISLLDKSAGLPLDDSLSRTLKLFRIERGPFASKLSAENELPTESQKKFMNDVFEHIMDRATSALATGAAKSPTVTTLEDVIEHVVDRGDDYNLPCADVNERRPILCSDEEYKNLVLANIGRVHSELLRRLMRDPRWDPNACLLDGEGTGPDDEATGQTVLHLAVEGKSEVLVIELLNNGSDHTRRDAKGRTPLLLVESAISLRTLLHHGADILVRDNKGRSLWHIAAANNDVVILEHLLKVSSPSEIAAALQVTSKKGRTPLADAFSYVRKLRPSPSFLPQTASKPGAALLLLPHCKDRPGCLQSDTPLMHLAAEWAVPELVERLGSAAADELQLSDANGRTPLHCLNISATTELITALRAKCGEGLPLQTKDGKTPAETVMLNFESEEPMDVRMRSNVTGHPSFVSKIDGEAFAALLTPETIKSRDDRDRTLWERFCTDVLLYYSHRPAFWSLVGPLIDMTIAGLVKAGAHREYEKQHEKSAFLPLVAGVWEESKLIPPWLMKPCITLLAAETEHFDKIKEEPPVLLTLRWAAAGDRCELTEALLNRKVSIHSSVRGLSTMDEACLPGICNMEMFKRLLQHAEPARMNDVNVCGRTPLQSLCFEQDAENRRVLDRELKVKLLLQNGADPNLPYQAEGMPPAVLAIRRDLADCARVLLENGADPKCKGEDGMDIALAAALKGCMRLLSWLQDKFGADWDWKATCSVSVAMGKDLWRKTAIHGCNALHLAALNDHVTALEFYLNNSYVDLDQRNHDSALLPLHFAAMGGSVEVIRFLASKGVDIDAKTGLEEATALHLATRARHPECVRTLLGLGCAREPRDVDGLTPLVMAIKINAVAVRSTLLGEITGSPVPNPFGPNRRTLLALGEAMETAIRQLDVQMVDYILDLGCPVDIVLPSCKGCTPLLLAIRQGKAPVARRLLDRGARKFAGHCQKHFGRVYNAVHEACLKENRLVCLDDVLDAALRVDHNWLQADVSPLQVAAEQKNAAALQALLDHIKEHIDQYSKWILFPPAKEPPPLALTAPADVVRPDVHPVVRDIVNLCLDAPEIDAAYFDNSTALHMALTVNDNLPVIRLLLENGADPDAQDVVLYTSLHMAARERQTEAVPLLLQYGADVDARDGDGYTPLLRACRAGSLAIVEQLLAAGADPLHRCPEGVNALGCAAEAHSGEPFRHLLTHVPELDPHERDLMGYSPAHDMLLNPKLTAFALSGAVDLRPVAEGDDLAKGLFSLLTETEDADRTLPRVLRRWPPDRLAAFINTWPARHVSPLCNVAVRGYTDDVRLFLRHGADIEMEGCDHGTPLMVAAAHGRLEAVRLLVGAGARVAYVDRRGVVRNAVANAATRAVRDWLLVGRYTEPNRLTERGEAGREAVEIRPWSGGGQIEYMMTGTGREHGQTCDESLLQYLVRIAAIKRQMAGRYTVPYNPPDET